VGPLGSQWVALLCRGRGAPGLLRATASGRDPVIIVQLRPAPQVSCRSRLGDAGCVAKVHTGKVLYLPTILYKGSPVCTHTRRRGPLLPRELRRGAALATPAIPMIPIPGGPTSGGDTAEIRRPSCGRYRLSPVAAGLPYLAHRHLRSLPTLERRRRHGARPGRGAGRSGRW
jgi:hypothetical protein